MGAAETLRIADGSAPQFAFITDDAFSLDECGVLAISEHALDDLYAEATGREIFPAQDFIVTYVHPTQTQAQQRAQEGAHLADAPRAELESVRTSARMLREIALRSAQRTAFSGTSVPVLSPVGRFLVHCANIAELTKSAELGVRPAHTSEHLANEEMSLVLASEAFQDSRNVDALRALAEHWPFVFAMNIPEGSALGAAREHLDQELHLLSQADSTITGNVAHDQVSLGSARRALDQAAGVATGLMDTRFGRPHGERGRSADGRGRSADGRGLNP